MKIFSNHFVFCGLMDKKTAMV